MQKHNVFSIFFVTVQSIFMIVLIGYIPPYIDRKMNTMELINEAFILLITYHFYTFTAFTPDIGTREQVGQSLLVVTICSIVLNFGLITYTNVSILARKFKLRHLKWKRD